MIKRILGFLLSVSLFAASASTLAAQEIPSPYRFVETRQEWGIFVGSASTSTGQLGIGPKAGDLIGGRFLIDFGSSLGLEVNTSLMFSDRDVFDPRRDPGDQIIGEAQIDVGTIDLRLRLNLTGHRSWHGFQPFVFLGGGVAFEGLQDRTLEAAAGFLEADVYAFGTRFMASAGGGIAYHLSERFVLRANGVMKLWKISTPSGFRDASRQIPLDFATIPPDQWVAAKSLTIGLSLRR